MIRIVTLALAVLLPGGALAQDLVKVQMGVVGASADVVFWSGVEKGYFRQEGVDLRITKFDSAARMIAPLASGELQVATGGISAGFFNAVARGIDVKIVADKTQTVPGLGTQTLLVRKDLIESGRFRTLADLRGMKVASPAPGSASMTIMTKMLARAGLTIKDIDSVFLAVPQMTAAFTNKALDAGVPLEPGVSQALQTGLVARVLEDFDVYPQHQIAAIFFSGGFIREHRAAAVGFLRAYLRSVRELNRALQDGRLTGPGSDFLIGLLTRFGPSQTPAFYQSFRLGFSHPDGTLHLASLQEDLQIFKSEGLIEGDVTIDKAVDQSLLAEALRAVGPYQP